MDQETELSGESVKVKRLSGDGKEGGNVEGYRRESKDHAGGSDYSLTSTGNERQRMRDRG